MHDTAHPLAGQEVVLQGAAPSIDSAVGKGAKFVVEDYWDRVSGGSWMFAKGNPAAMMYAIRSAVVDLPLDDEVLYGKIGGLGHLVHVSEL